MKNKITLFLIVILLGSFISAQSSIRVGPTIGFNKAQDFSFEAVNSALDVSFDNEFQYGFKAKLDLPAITIAGSITKMNFKKGIFERDFSLISVGPEFKLLPGPVNPYLAADLLISSYDLSISNIGTFDNSAFGLGVGAGVDFKLFPLVDIDVSIKYNFTNLFGKEDGEEAFNTMTFSAAVLFSLL